MNRHCERSEAIRHPRYYAIARPPFLTPCHCEERSDEAISPDFKDLLSPMREMIKVMGK